MITGANGKNFITITVCVSGKNKEKEALFVRCIMFGKTADFVGQYAQEKDTVYVSGELEKRRYTNKQGVEKDTYQLIAREVQLFHREKSDFNRQAQTDTVQEPNGNVADEIVLPEEEMF
jgi:single-strand DNA-binding protein